jgi:branched chain amino acid efflux pump
MTQIDPNIIWLLLILIGTGTFCLRLSFIALLGRLEIKPVVTNLLRFVPPAALAALIFPAILAPGGEIDISLSNGRLAAGLVAAAVSYFSKNILATIGSGMVVLWVFQALFG